MEVEDWFGGEGRQATTKRSFPFLIRSNGPQEAEDREEQIRWQGWGGKWRLSGWRIFLLSVWVENDDEELGRASVSAEATIVTSSFFQIIDLLIYKCFILLLIPNPLLLTFSFFIRVIWLNEHVPLFTIFTLICFPPKKTKKTKKSIYLLLLPFLPK